MSLTITFIGHDASRSGAPIHLLRLIRWFAGTSDFRLRLVLLGGGPLLSEYEAVCATTMLEPTRWFDRASDLALAGVSRPPGTATLLGRLGASLVERGVRRRARALATALRGSDVVFANTIASGVALLELSRAPELLSGGGVVLQLHEMADVLDVVTLRHRQRTCSSLAETIASACRLATTVITVSAAARRDLERVAAEREPALGDKIVTLPPCIELNVSSPVRSDAALGPLRDSLGLADDALVVVGSGPIGWRKGSDLFLLLARELAQQLGERFHAVWVGGFEREGYSLERASLMRQVELVGLAGRFHCLPELADPAPVWALADVFVVASREDPFPMAAVEAAAAGTAVVCFDASGTAELLENSAELVAPFLDVTALGNRVAALLTDPVRRERVARRLAERASAYTVEQLGPQYQRTIESVAGRR